MSEMSDNACRMGGGVAKKSSKYRQIKDVGTLWSVLANAVDGRESAEPSADVGLISHQQF